MMPTNRGRARGSRREGWKGGSDDTDFPEDTKQRKDSLVSQSRYAAIAEVGDDVMQHGGFIKNNGKSDKESAPLERWILTPDRRQISQNGQEIALQKEDHVKQNRGKAKNKGSFKPVGKENQAPLGLSHLSPKARTESTGIKLQASQKQFKPKTQSAGRRTLLVVKGNMNEVSSMQIDREENGSQRLGPIDLSPNQEQGTKSRERTISNGSSSATAIPLDPGENNKALVLFKEILSEDQRNMEQDIYLGNINEEELDSDWESADEEMAHMPRESRKKGHGGAPG